MNLRQHTDLDKLIAALNKPEDLAMAASAFAETWHDRHGQDGNACGAFLDAFIESIERDDFRNNMIAAMDAYRTPDWAKN